MSNKSIKNSERSTPQRQLPRELAEVVAGWDDLFQQAESNGCPPDTAAHLREQFQVALIEILEESEWRDFLFTEIRKNLKLLSSSSPSGALEVLDEMNDLASRLPDEEEQKHVIGLLALLAPLRKSLLGGQS